MNRDELIETIQRLFALSSSSNEHESALALARANELMMKHNISMFDVETQKNNAEYSVDAVYTAGRSTSTEPFICDILQNYFFVKAISTRNRNMNQTTLRFFGDKTNVKIAKYVFNVLDLYFKVFADANHIPARYRRNYYAGLMVGFKEKLKKEREAFASQSGNRNALVLVDKALVIAFQNRFPMTINKKHSAMHNNSNTDEAFNQGVEDGKEINLRKGLAGERVDQPKLQ